MSREAQPWGDNSGAEFDRIPGRRIEAPEWLFAPDGVGQVAHLAAPGQPHLPDGQVLQVLIDGRRCDTLDSAVEVFAEAFEFPDYYGHNLDAFNECMSDLLAVGPKGGVGSAFADRPGLDAVAVVARVDHAESFLPDRDDMTRFVDLMDGVLNQPPMAGDRMVPFFLIAQSNRSDTPGAD